MNGQHCDLKHGMHCKTRRYTYSTLGVLALIVAAIVLILPRMAAADDENPTTLNVQAPELTGHDWVNGSTNLPVKLASRHGKVTLVHFWTYGCINCKRNLPIYQKWQKEFTGQDVAIIGVHTPETQEEHSLVNVRQALKRNGITYPVLIDTDHANWDRWSVRYWPTVFLLDKQGKVRYRWEGELEYNNQNGTAKMARLIKELQNEK